MTQCLSALRRFSAKGSCHTGSTQLISRPPGPTISLAHSIHSSDDCASGEASLLPTSGLPPVCPAPAVTSRPVPLWCITAEGPRCRVQASKTTMRNQRNGQDLLVDPVINSQDRDTLSLAGNPPEINTPLRLHLKQDETAPASRVPTSGRQLAYLAPPHTRVTKDASRSGSSSPHSFVYP